ncbi:MAG: hypothetical protein KJ658_09595 [Proteobacteria bacterium]|nr:hypothetical protein [Pseudomonadota bacterium]
MDWLLDKTFVLAFQMLGSLCLNLLWVIATHSLDQNHLIQIRPAGDMEFLLFKDCPMSCPSNSQNFHPIFLFSQQA